jgi:hypothetical protein
VVISSIMGMTRDLIVVISSIVGITHSLWSPVLWV